MALEMERKRDRGVEPLSRPWEGRARPLYQSRNSSSHEVVTHQQSFYLLPARGQGEKPGRHGLTASGRGIRESREAEGGTRRAAGPARGRAGAGTFSQNPRKKLATRPPAVTLGKPVLPQRVPRGYKLSYIFTKGSHVPDFLASAPPP